MSQCMGTRACQFKAIMVVMLCTMQSVHKLGGSSYGGNWVLCVVG